MRWAISKQATYWYCSPFYSQTERIVWDDPQMLDKYLPPGWKKDNNAHTIKAPNGSMIYFLGADKPETLRGPNPYGVIFDEMDDIKLSVWTDIVRPVLAMNGGWAWFMGTPKGQGSLFQMFNKQDKDWMSFLLRASESGLFQQEELDKAKADLPQAIYNQEFECAFIAGGSQVFRRINENLIDEQWQIEPKFQYKIGVDLAKLNDWTVFTPLNLHNWHLGPIERFNQVDYPLVEAKLEAFWRRYNQAQLTVDSTGVGEPVCDHLDRNGINVQRFTFTEESRTQLLTNFALLLEKDLIKITKQGNEQLITEMNAMRYELGGIEKKKIKIASVISDDCVMSAALAFHGIYAKLPLAYQEFIRPKQHSKMNAFY